MVSGTKQENALMVRRVYNVYGPRYENEQGFFFVQKNNNIHSETMRVEKQPL